MSCSQPSFIPQTLMVKGELHKWKQSCKQQYINQGAFVEQEIKKKIRKKN